MKPSSSKPTITRNHRSNAEVKEDNTKMLEELNLPPDTTRITTALTRRSKAQKAKNVLVSTQNVPVIATSVLPPRAPATSVLPPQAPATSVPSQNRMNYSKFRAQKQDKAKNPQLDDTDLTFLIDHMSVPANHAKLMGSGPKTQQPAKPLPTLNANEVKKKRTVDSALKQSNSKRLNFFKEQIDLASIKQDKRAHIASTSAADALAFEKEKWETQQVRKDAKSASEAAQLFKISQATRDHEDKKARREAIERCCKEKMPMEEIKEYIDFLFPPSETA
ncbi:uncharacterized protein MELLADRAFT_113058 [Melampsora larici-populina 98AG31]|uniref:Uncharacterized protein n=1 Tax=Melampsora larici-populina (strain 98AG31 / pathotype 3-4-7) TaxID=747676 RepID=F4S8M7_MELLP|nr:uncharacterized protein MELLADRAFT_113058 [Melampsora larici-populina 98AG31]EGF99043.1 hypothetical protein MELLADRAFT_113058 [Melampsora larici-populina 98AG31]